MNNLSSISVTILAKNAQKTLYECLLALKDFDEVILLDNQSSDDTRQIAQSFPNVRIYENEFIGFGALKNLAISYAKNDWILSIDSDEVLESSAIEEIKTLALNENTIYSLPRKNLYKGEWIKACGWYPDYVKRLFNRKITRFNDNVVHESVIVPQQCREARLQNAIKHYTATNMESIITKMNTYTTHSAQEKYYKGKKPNLLLAIFRFHIVFIKDYFIRKGFLYGYKGFNIALLNSLGAYFRYAKIYDFQAQKESK